MSLMALLSGSTWQVRPADGGQSVPCSLREDGSAVYGRRQGRWTLAAGELRLHLDINSARGARREHVTFSFSVEPRAMEGATILSAQRGPLRYQWHRHAPERRPRGAIFLCHAPEDQAFAQALLLHMAALAQQAQLSFQDDHRTAGTVIALVSASLLASASLRTKIASAQAEGALLCPVLIRPCDGWLQAFPKIQVLPRSHEPISLMKDHDAAWVEVIGELRSLFGSSSL